MNNELNIKVIGGSRNIQVSRILTVLCTRVQKIGLHNLNIVYNLKKDKKQKTTTLNIFFYAFKLALVTFLFL